MIHKVRFPKLSANIEEATIMSWLKREGEVISAGEPLVEAATEKGVVEVESPCSGTLRQLIAPVNSTLPVGYIIALVGDPGDELPNVEPLNQSLMDKHRAAAAEEDEPRAGNIKKRTRSRVRATPAARRLAKEKGLDLEDVAAVMNAEVVNNAVIDEYLGRED
ncbi:MAG: E3 binding domain-containing protein [Candidatus Pacebacteria bacterium]|nr:E3 binding domain-containing protein [Candidatus Paceibacterota bacterium]